MQVEPGKRDVRKQFSIPNDRFGKDAFAILGVDEYPRLRPHRSRGGRDAPTAKPVRVRRVALRRFADKYFERPKSRLADAQQALVVLFARRGKQGKSFGERVLPVERNRAGNEVCGWIFVAHRLQGAPQSFQVGWASGGWA